MRGRIVYLSMLGLMLAIGASYWALDREETSVAEARSQVSHYRLLVTSDGITHADVQGTDGSPRIVLIHGGTVPMVVWDDYMGPLQSAGYQVLRYDLFGRGLSDRIDGPYDRELHQRQLTELLAQLTWSDQPLDLVGYSFGGATAATFAARNPGLVRKLVLIAPVVDYREHIPLVARVPLMGEFFVRVFGVPRAVGRIREMASKLPDGAALFAQFEAMSTTEGFEDLLLSLARSDALGDYRDTYQQVGTQAIPTLLFWGQTDNEIPGDHMNLVRKRIPGLMYRPIAGAGHEIGTSHHREVLALMLPWLEEDR